ncbi:hypothetical protein mRhiFer1_010011 [Rhinolophus ferrumequinum]|uniref:Uncharacterized protein n=1 Tax=Rhinolophus ferrumequinum TaxID=59479 RepID=A0A7J7Y541_RHIFE|nr:hypothetical protein mRhiFer1_010011 [Rhinolophus ferrumequinum]
MSVAATQGQKTSDTFASTSKNSSCTNSEDKFTGAAKLQLQQEALQHRQMPPATTQGQNSSEAFASTSQYSSCTDSEGLSDRPKYDRQPAHSSEDNIMIHGASDRSIESQYLPGTSSSQSLSSTAKLQLQQEALQHRQIPAATTQGENSSEAFASSSQYSSCTDSEGKLSGAGLSNLLKYDRQPGHSLKDNILVHGARGRSAESQYLPRTSSSHCLSSTGKEKGKAGKVQADHDSGV